MAEEIALVPRTTENPDDEDSDTRKHDQISDDAPNPNEQVHVFNRIFHLNESLQHFLLWNFLFISMFIIAGPLTLHIASSVPTVKTRNIAAHVFSEERARDSLINLTQYGSRVSNTHGNFQAQKFLLAKLEQMHSMNKRQLRFEIDLQNFTDYNHNQLQNVIVRVSNSLKEFHDAPSLMLSAHYDSVEFSPGGSDDGSGVVILLELLSNVINDVTITLSDLHLIVLFTNSEEMNLQGSRAFITKHMWRYDIHRYINVDAVSCKQVASLIQISSSQLLIDYARVPRPHANVILESIPQWLHIATDYDAFAKYSPSLGYNFGFFVDGYTYHTPFDDSSTIRQGVFQEIGENLNILIRHILIGDIHLVEKDNNDPFIYFDVLGRQLIVYKISTSLIIQRILISLIIIISVILIVLDHRYHRQSSFECVNVHCIYTHLKYPLLTRLISLIIYLIINLISISIGLLVSMTVAWIMSIIQPVSWFGRPILAILLFSLPCLIGFLTITFFSNRFHRIMSRKYPRKTFILHPNVNELNFDFEQNFSVIFVYACFMIGSIYTASRLSYIILIWSIFICPMYLLLIIIEFLIHWNYLHCHFFQQQQQYHWLYLPLIISLLPLAHTIEIVNRLIRILIPILGRRFFFRQPWYENCMIANIIAIPTILFVLAFSPVLQRMKRFGQLLISLSMIFLIIFIVACIVSPFNRVYPKAFYAKHASISTFKAEKLSNVPMHALLLSQSSSISVLTYGDVALSPILDQFSTKTGHILQKKHCRKKTVCIFDDTFNRTIAVQSIQIESMMNSTNYTIVVQHVSTYHIQISSSSLIELNVRNRLNIPRTETIIDVSLKSSLNSFEIDINIQRCDLVDSPFLLSFIRSIPNIVPMGDASCNTIEDRVRLIINLNTSSKA